MRQRLQAAERRLSGIDAAMNELRSHRPTPLSEYSNNQSRLSNAAPRRLQQAQRQPYAGQLGLFNPQAQEKQTVQRNMVQACNQDLELAYYYEAVIAACTE